VKAALYFLLAILDLGFAWYFYSNGRIVFPAIAAFAGLGFVLAGVGTLLQQRGSGETVDR
jgi:hypothetical protein